MTEATNSVTISGRISDEDHQFLLSFPLDGKVTISEKLRHVCTFFRQYHSNLEGYSTCLEQLNLELRPALGDIKEMENKEGVHSELVDKLLHFLPEMMAFLITQRRQVEPNGKPAGDLKHLVEMEARLFDQCLVLVESLLRMGLTTKSPTYNPNLLKNRLNTIQELAALLPDTSSQNS